VKGAMMIKAPVAVMEGDVSGAADLHYGSNVSLVRGHRYTITVGLNGQHAVFQVTVG
jgi:hypothetical protein